MKESVVAYYAVSKELDEREAAALGGEKAFLLSSGDIKLMDLCYCPFGKPALPAIKNVFIPSRTKTAGRFPCAVTFPRRETAASRYSIAPNWSAAVLRAWENCSTVPR
ncbi:MAG: hypothetical protein ACLR06_10595 [Christensenellaceae bacterium]